LYTTKKNNINGTLLAKLSVVYSRIREREAKKLGAC